MGMTPSSGGWAEAKEKGLKTYTGKPCITCSGTVKTTHNKECINKCYRDRNQKYKFLCKDLKNNAPKFPERTWQKLAPDFSRDNLEIPYS